MKTTNYFIASIIFVLSIGFTFAQSSSTIKLGKHYGPVRVDTSKAISPTEMIMKFAKEAKPMEFTVSAQVVKVCQSAGCWIDIDLRDGKLFRISFKEHFRIPMKTKAGTRVYFHCTAYWDSVSVELQQYNARVAGVSEMEIINITEPKAEMIFIADGIVLVKK